jgi:hypothetical protein
MAYPNSFSGSIDLPRDGRPIERVMEAIERAIEHENGWVVSKGENELEFTGRAWRLGLSRGALTAATTGSVRVTEDGDQWRIDYRVGLTSVVLLSIVGVLWVGVPLWLAPGIPPVVALAIASLAFLAITGSAYLTSSHRFARTLRCQAHNYKIVDHPD